jgi:hypothetical protein
VRGWRQWPKLFSSFLTEKVTRREEFTVGRVRACVRLMNISYSLSRSLLEFGANSIELPFTLELTSTRMPSKTSSLGFGAVPLLRERLRALCLSQRCGAQQEPLTPANAIGPDNSELACAAIKSGGQAGAQSNLRRRSGKSLASKRVADNRDEGTRCSDDDFTKPKTAKKCRQSFFLLVFTGRGGLLLQHGHARVCDHENALCRERHSQQHRLHLP